MGGIKKVRLFLNHLFSSKLSQYVFSILVIGITALISRPLANTQNYHVVSFILLFVVSILSTFLAVGPLLVASTLSALAWNFYFIPPHHTFNIEKTEDILIFALFFIIAFVNSVLTTRIRRQEKLARERERRTDALFQLTKELLKASGIEEVVHVAREELSGHFNIETYFLLQDGNNKLIFRDPAQNFELPDDEHAVAVWVFSHSKEAGAYTANRFEAIHTFFPLPGNRINPGVLAVKLNNRLPDDQKSYWDAFLAQISNALEREFLGELAQKVRFLDESDRLYKTLFNSISHELRIPVATIMGASDSIIHSTTSESVRSELCSEIFTASVRLNRLIENLLNISRLESGHISVRLDWYDINDLINKVTEDLHDELNSFFFRAIIPQEMPLVKIDFGLMEQVLYNLLYNATQYTSPGSKIEVITGYHQGFMHIEVIDSGPGFPEGVKMNVFKKFFRVDGSRTGGLGLGLSIVKGFVEAHNGTIDLEKVKGGGAKFLIKIPSDKPQIDNF